MRSVEPNRPPISVRPAPPMDPEEQIDVRLRQMIVSHTEAYLLAIIDKRIAGRIGAAIEAACGTMIATGGGYLIGKADDSPLGRLQASLAARVDMSALDAAVEAIVATRVQSLFAVAAKMTDVPSAPINVEGVPIKSEEQAFRDARGALNDPRLSSLHGGIDIDDSRS